MFEYSQQAGDSFQTPSAVFAKPLAVSARVASSTILPVLPTVSPVCAC
jgi:hypothetical protein